MTRTANARIAGFTFLIYIAIGIASMVLYSQATRGENISAKLVCVVAEADCSDAHIQKCRISPLRLGVIIHGKNIAVRVLKPGDVIS